MVKTLSVLGSTGSIGTQTLAVAEKLNIRVVALAAGKNIELVRQQALKFMPSLVSVESEKDAEELRKELEPKGIKVLSGDEGLIATAKADADILLTAIVGMKGLLPTLAALDDGRDIALANKETMVVGGEIVTKRAAETGSKIYPVDSEHSAILQSLMGNDKSQVEKIILTASGGPFRTMAKSELENVTIKDVLNHPTWKMGGKITVDCASMMNKGLEIIEARWLFDMPYEKIDVLVHPQSIVHSMVQYRDGAVIAQMGVPDMKIPIQLALTYPNRENSDFERVDFTKQALTFELPDEDKFPCLKLAKEAAKIGGTMTAAMNGANEAAVAAFLAGKIRFTEIADIVSNAMKSHSVISKPTVEDILRVDAEARSAAVR